jgi:hypothetical protein
MSNKERKESGKTMSDDGILCTANEYLENKDHYDKILEKNPKKKCKKRDKYDYEKKYECIEVVYKEKKYTVIKLNYRKKGKEQIIIPVVIDTDDIKLFENTTWYLTHLGYVVSTHKYNGIYLHRAVTRCNPKPGMGSYISVDHCNRIPTDNRKANLRLVTVELQARNQTKRSRNVTLPMDSFIDPEKIPSNIHYYKESGTHGDYFEVALKLPSGKRIRKKSTKQKKVPLLHKLNQAKKMLFEMVKEHPKYFKNKDYGGFLCEEDQILEQEYFDIIQIAGMKDPIHDPLSANENLLDIDGHIAEHHIKNKSKYIKFKLPKLVRYAQSNYKRGSLFEFESRKNNKRIQIRSTSSIYKSDEYKIMHLFRKLYIGKHDMTKDYIRILLKLGMKDPVNNFVDEIDNLMIKESDRFDKCKNDEMSEKKENEDKKIEKYLCEQKKIILDNSDKALIYQKKAKLYTNKQLPPVETKIIKLPPRVRYVPKVKKRGSSFRYRSETNGRMIEMVSTSSFYISDNNKLYSLACKLLTKKLISLSDYYYYLKLAGAKNPEHMTNDEIDQHFVGDEDKNKEHDPLVKSCISFLPKNVHFAKGNATHAPHFKYRKQMYGKKILILSTTAGNTNNKLSDIVKKLLKRHLLVW